MVRLVKGAYWDGEIKRAQVDGLDGYPVFTRKIHTDVSYLACARKLLAAPDAVFPQFATHNAQTLAAVHAMAGENFYAGQYEFQCLHGMGEPLYEQVVGPDKLDRPCRIYAPVGTHETLLAYLVRRLLENGANTSFVNRIADPDGADRRAGRRSGRAGAARCSRSARRIRASRCRATSTAARAQFARARPRQRARARGACRDAAGKAPSRWPRCADAGATVRATARARAVRNPADRRDVVGTVVEATPDAGRRAPARRRAPWQATPARARRDCLGAPPT